MDNTGKPIDLKMTCKIDIYPNELSLPRLSSHLFFLLEIISPSLFPLWEIIFIYFQPSS